MSDPWIELGSRARADCATLAHTFVYVISQVVLSSPFTSPKASGPIDSQVLKNALARLNQLDALDRSFSSPSPDLYSPENRSPERTFSASLNGAYRPGVMNSSAH